MDALISFWSHALAALLFLALAIWRLKHAARQPAQRLLAAAFALTACWAWLSAVMPGDPLNGFAESARNLVWIGLLYSLSAAGEERQHGVRLVYGAVAAVVGMQLIAQLLGLFQPSEVVAKTNLILHITTAAGALVLVHNLYGQASPVSRSHIRLAMIGLAWLWGYDLNLYTLAYLGAPSAAGLAEWRGGAVALTAPLFALGARDESGWRIRLSRAATFQSLSLLAICAYFALMAIVATALRGSGFEQYVEIALPPPSFVDTRDEAAKLREAGAEEADRVRGAHQERRRRGQDNHRRTSAPPPTRGQEAHPRERTSAQAAQMKRDAELRIAAEIEIGRARSSAARSRRPPRPPRPRSCSARRPPPTIRRSSSVTSSPEWEPLGVMVSGSLARRYAKAVFEIGAKDGSLVKIGADLKSLAKAMKESAELTNAVASPAIRRQDRKKVLEAVMQRIGTQPVTNNLATSCSTASAWPRCRRFPASSTR